MLNIADLFMLLQKLDPKTHHFPMSEDDLRCITKACDDGTIDLRKIGNSYRSRIELWHNQGVIIMHTFSQTEAEDCLQSLKQHLSTLKVVIQINVTTLQLKYLKINKQDALKLCKVTTEASESAPPKLKLEGTRSQVERSRKVLQQLLSGIVSRSHKQTHNKYILMWKKCWEEVNNKVSLDKKLYVELSTAVSDGSLTCELIVVGEDVQNVEDVISSVRKIDGSFKECVISTDAMGVKIVSEGLKSGKIEVKKDYIYHIDITANSIVVVSPYCMQTEEIHKTIKEYISSEKETRKIIKKSFTLQYSFLAKVLKLNWSKVQEIAKHNKILSINLVTDPCCAIEVKGNEAAIKQAEPEIFQHILSLESDVACSVVPVDYYSCPALTSPEFLQLCKELENNLAISLTVQIYPEVLSSAIVQLNGSDGIRVEVCQGSISLDNSEVIVNFTDTNLTVCKTLKTVVGESVVIDCTHHITSCGPLSPGKAISFCKFGDDGNPAVIHAIIPNWVNGKSGESNLISNAISESLKRAAECNAKSVSLPFISCIDKDLPAEFLAEACLSAVQEFCEELSSIEKIRFVLSIDMAEKFQDEFTTGSFQQWIVEGKPSIWSSTPDDTTLPSTTVESIWLWKDDDGKYYRYQAAENNILNQESTYNSSCILKIGRFSYTIDFIAMTQTNTSTARVRNIKKITTDHIWKYKNNLQKWERFSLQDSIKIEIMYVTQDCSPLMINGQMYNYDFDNMTQQNNHSKTAIKRTIVNMPSVKSDEKQKVGESKVLVSGLAADIRTAKEKLEGCVRSLSVVKCIDIQSKLVPILDKHVSRIQNDFRVEIHSWPDNPAISSDTKAKYNVTGYKNCVQEAITEVYQILTSSSASIVHSFAKPTEWEPQSNPIELKDVPQGSSEWNKILHHMQQTIPNVNLVSIKRIQNEFLWEKYCQHKERMGRKGPERINEMELFHGTSNNPPEDIYKSEEGFDMRFSRTGMWGQGNYFAESAQYSCNYAYTTTDTVQVHSFVRYGYHTSSSVQQMFLVKVLTGDSFASPSNKTLRMPPYKPSASSEKVRYDTVNGVTQGSKVYITYSNDKAYPLYLISFT